MMQQVWKTVCQEFFDGPVVETLSFHCQRSDSITQEPSCQTRSIGKPWGLDKSREYLFREIYLGDKAHGK